MLKEAKKKLYIQTLGCAMNERDSEHMIAELNKKENYELTQDQKLADLILINTCSIREKPESKLFSELGIFNKNKKQGAKIGVCGCTASHMGKEIIKRAPYVNFVLGARNISKISKIIHQDKAVEVDLDYDDSSYIFSDYKGSKTKANVNISIGCDKKCTYCIVPNTRGKEISIPSSLILSEIKKLAKVGIKEILLLGQNVNNYGKRFSSKQEDTNFTKLLNMISKIEGIERIRFTSPHPLHMDDEFLEEFINNPKISKAIHMPLQSGSTKVLKRMKRGYSKDWFLNRALKIRELCPQASISTDIIVGFPGENEEDFLDTMDVIKKVKFEQIFSFKYSKRPNTEATYYEDLVEPEVASKRLSLLQDYHKKILDELAKKNQNKIYEVLFDNFNEEGYLLGRTDNNILVKIKDKENLIGEIKKVKIIKSSRVSAIGELIV